MDTVETVSVECRATTHGMLPCADPLLLHHSHSAWIQPLCLHSSAVRVEYAGMQLSRPAQTVKHKNRDNTVRTDEEPDCAVGRQCRADQASAIWLLQELPVHRNRMLGGDGAVMAMATRTPIVS